MKIDRPNQVWFADITFVPVKNGFLYLVAIMDWATRKVLSSRLSNTMHADFCVEALNEAIAKNGPVSSTGQRKGCIEPIRGRCITKCFSWARIQLQRHLVEIVLAEG